MTDELRQTIEAVSQRCERVSSALGFAPDADLVREISMSEMVVLPYRFMHNSGAVLLALSLDRPVLVPDNEVNRCSRSKSVAIGFTEPRRFGAA
ncbi:hypothetical protein GS432_01345 [Rhodococcus hoagii]|nr:hypothetical protein [Prescottella equi]